jgi:tetratricopeptide (TPR) repeat protein
MIRLATSLLFVALSAAAQVKQPEQTSLPNAQSGFAQVSQAADSARDAGRSEEAIQLYKRALGFRPKWKDGLWSLSSLLYGQNHYADARESLRRLVAIDPELGLAWAMLGMSEFELRDYARALDHLRRAMAEGMGDQKDIAESVFYYVAVLENRFELFDDSTSLLIAMVKSGQDSKPLVEPIGLAALRLPFLPAEIPADRHEMIRQAGEATLALEAQRRDEAGKLFLGLTERYPNEPGVHFLYGAFLLDENPEAGIQEMKKELQVSPSNVSARLRLAEEYTKQQNPDSALPLAQEAVKLDPKRSSAHMMLGEVLIAKEDSLGGIRELETAREQAPQTVRIHWDLLRAYTAAGRSEEARREKEEIEKLSSARNQ